MAAWYLSHIHLTSGSTLYLMCSLPQNDMRKVKPSGEMF